MSFQFLLQFLLSNQRFEAESTENCNYDYLSVYDGKNSFGSLIDKLCGMVYPEKITTQTNHMYIQFISDETAGGFGFNLTYVIEDPLRQFFFCFFLYIRDPLLSIKFNVVFTLHILM